MKLWHIVDEDSVMVIEAGKVTILQGSNTIWYKLVRSVDDFFMKRGSEVKIYEDTQLLHKNDWEILFIPFDANMQFDKVTAKSPLKILLENVSSELTMSPVYLEMVNVWDELREEIEMINHRLEKYELKVQLKSLESEQIMSLITFKSVQKEMTPIEYKKLLLKLFADRIIEKRKLIIIELPELYASPNQFADIISMINDLTAKGIMFIIVTQSNKVDGNKNYLYQGKIINEASIEIIKQKVISELPFYCEQSLYEEAKKCLLQIVDNNVSYEEFKELSTIQNDKIRVLLLLMAYHLEIRINIDITGIPANIEAFIKTCS